VIAAVLIAYRAHQDVAAIAVTVFLGLPSLYLTYLAVKQSVPAEARLAELADLLAAAVHAQWIAEAAARRLDQPYQIPLRWVPAEPVLVDRWSTLTKLTASSDAWPQRTRDWASSPAKLAGGGKLADVLARVPTGRLVVLGEPGAGKTVLVLRLVLDLLARRKSGDPVPVLVSVAAWDPGAQKLRDWLAEQMAVSYPALTGTAGRASAARRSRELLDSGLILPVLDGLDEIPRMPEGPAIDRINDALRDGDRLVVTCRRAEYLAAITSPGRPWHPLHGAAGIEVRSLDPATVTSYLHDDSAPQDQDSSWRSALTGLAADAPLMTALSSPLLLALAKAIYNPRPGEFSGPPPDPSELRDLPSQAAIEDRLLTAFVNAAYRNANPESSSGRSWSADQAQRWLGFLAGHLESTIRGPDFAWWQLIRAVPSPVAGVAAGLLTGAVTCLAVTVSLVLFYLTVHPDQLHTTAVPAIGAAAIAAALYVPLAFLLPGLVTAFAVTRTGRPGPTRWPALLPAVGSAFVGLMIGAATWHYIDPHWAAAALGVLATIVAGAVARYARRTGRSQDLRRGIVAGFVVAAMVGVVFYVTQTVLTEDFVKGLIWARTWVVLTGLTAAIGAARESERADHPAIGARWRARKGALGALALGSVAVLIGELVDRQAFGLPLSVVLGASSAVAAGAVYGLERVGGDTTAIAGPSAVLARDRRAALLLTLVTGIAVTVLTGVAVTTWNESYELLGSAPDNAVVFGDGLAMGPGTGIAIAAGLAVTAFGVAWPRWLVARGWLALRGRLPFRLMSFLNDAHQRGVLRQAGPFYQFRHIELQHHLARRFAASAPGQPGPGPVGPKGAGTGPPRRRSLQWWRR
jgi:hypothetical protein